MTTFVTDPPEDDTARRSLGPAHTSADPLLFDDDRLHPEKTKVARSSDRRAGWRQHAGTIVSTAGVIAIAFVLFQLVVAPIIRARAQRDLAGEMTTRINTVAALSSGGQGTDGGTGQAELIFGAFDPERPEIPDLVGEISTDAVAELEALGFRVVRTPEPARHVIPGLVTRTNPPAGQVLAVGEEVTVFVSVLAPGAPVATLTIDRIGLSEIVVEGTSSSQLMSGPGHYRDSPLPGQTGNAVIFGRRTTYGGPFRYLDQLDPGDEIKITTLGGEVSYEVTEVRVVEAGEADVVGQGDGRNLLTLVTSSPPYQSLDRLAVIAELRDEPIGRSHHAADGEIGQAVILSPEELGRDRDPTAWAPALLSFEALALGVILTGRLQSSWSRTTTWLIMAPPLAMAGLLLFESFTRLLPSTL